MAIALAVIAGRCNRCSYAWFMLGFFFNIVALAAVLLLPPKKAE
ncbi:MAG TPA: hypothetical protein VFF82_10830 [Rhodocyclaceae bacterium]|nr:hypothetical protein [Rhodocyclaceae bacterium]